MESHFNIQILGYNYGEFYSPGWLPLHMSYSKCSYSDAICKVVQVSR